ncbi:MAG: DnaB-like helicase N-terminal domain-containing protein [Armatimonadota bacterium]|nr:DnaB-like helicase N-terminal domain-containing protein [Armatimonadota bacterium]
MGGRSWKCPIANRHYLPRSKRRSLCPRRSGPQPTSAGGAAAAWSLLDSAALPQIREIVTGGDFYRQPHRLIFAAMGR